MAIAFDNATGAAASFASSITQALTVGSGSDRALFVGSFSNATSTTPTTATYNGVGLTADAAAVCTGFGKGAGYAMAAPASGANNVVTNYSDANAIVILIAMSYTGVDQTTPSSTGNGAATTSADATVNVTSDANDLIAAALYAASAFGTWTAGTGTTDRTVINGHRVGGDEPGGGGSTTINWTGTSDPWMLVAINLNVSGGAAAPTTFRQNISGTMRRGSRPLGAV